MGYLWNSFDDELGNYPLYSDRIRVTLVIIYLTLTLAAVASRFVSFLQALTLHGKTKKIVTLTYAHSLTRWIQQVTVPKSWFLHFYLVGFIVTLLVLTITVEQSTMFYMYEPTKSTLRWTLTQILLLLHLLRRCYECYYVHQYDSSRMHLVGYSIGLLHYSILPWNFLRHLPQRDTFDSTSVPTITTTTTSGFRIVLAVCLGWLGQYQQYRHHVLLAHLRTTKTTDDRYSIPHGGWFQYVGCPHYLAEILIYVGFFLLMPSIQTFALLVWVISNLTVSAWNSHQWYCRTFGHDYIKLQRKAIFPGLL